MPFARNLKSVHLFRMFIPQPNGITMTIKGLSLNWHHRTSPIHHILCKVRFYLSQKKKEKKLVKEKTGQEQLAAEVFQIFA